jgi:hypothetical protein
MRCLSMIADDLDETSLPAVVPVLFPALLSVVQDPSAGSSLARRALQVVNACLLAVAYLPAAAAGRMRPVVGPFVPGWLALCAAVVESPLAPGDAQQCGLQMEALKVAQRVRAHVALLAIALSIPIQSRLTPLLPPSPTQLLSSFPLPSPNGTLGAETQRVLAGMWGLLSRAHDVYLGSCVEVDPDTDDGPAAADSDGDELSLEMLVTQLLEAMLMMTGSARYSRFLEPAVQPLLALVLGFMRVSGPQVGRWSSDASEFVADQEEDFSSVRAVCEMLLDELLAELPATAAPALSASIQAALPLPADGGAAQQQHHRWGWWKAREAALFALGSTAEVFFEPGPPPGAPPYSQIVESLLHTELNPAAAAAARLPPLLIARALWTCGRLAPAVTAPQFAALLDAVASAMAPGAHPLLRVTAARCCAMVVSRPAAAPAVAPRALALMSLLTGLVAAHHDEEDTLDSALQALSKLVAAQPGCATAGAALLAPTLLKAWAAVFNDPQLCEGCSDVVAALVAASPAACEAIHCAALPQLRAVFLEAQTSTPPPGLLSAALELTLAAVSGHAGGEGASRSAHGLLLGPVMAVAQSSSDADVVQGAVDVLRALMRAAGDRLPAWGVDGAGGGGEATQALLGVAAAVLGRTGADADVAPCAGPLLCALLRAQPAACVPLLPVITSAVAQRLVGCAGDSGLAAQNAPLLRIFAILALHDAHALVDLLARHSEAAGWEAVEGGALGAVLRAWAAAQPELRGGSTIAQSTAALAAVACCGHPALERVLLRGELVEAAASGGGALIRTRSRAKATGPEQFTSVPATRALLALCADMLLEDEEARALRQEEEADEWSTDEEDGEGDQDEPRGRADLLDLVDQKLDSLAAAGEGGAFDGPSRRRDEDDGDDALAAPGAAATFIGTQLRQAAADPGRGAAIMAHASQLNTRRQQALQGAYALAASQPR